MAPMPGAAREVPLEHADPDPQVEEGEVEPEDEVAKALPLLAMVLRPRATEEGRSARSRTEPCGEHPLERSRPQCARHHIGPQAFQEKTCESSRLVYAFPVCQTPWRTFPLGRSEEDLTHQRT